MSENPNNRKLTLYDILEISPSASPEIVRASYITLAKKYHPDIYKGDPQKASNMMKAINYAYSVLSDPEKRQQYNAALASLRDPSTPPRQSSAPPPPTHSAPTSTSASRPKSGRFETFISGVFMCIFLGFCIACVFAAVMNLSETSTPQQSSQQSVQSVETNKTIHTSKTTSYTPPPLKSENEPYTGQILSGKSPDNESEITVTASSLHACVVKLKDVSGNTALSFYVRAGKTATVGIPSGYYYVYFASGKTWYNENTLFGADTSYFKDKTLLDFNSYTWEYTLQTSSNGNFNETYIKADEFKD